MKHLISWTCTFALIAPMVVAVAGIEYSALGWGGPAMMFFFGMAVRALCAEAFK